MEPKLEPSDQQPTKKKRVPSRGGRKGDPRMHRAVAARIADPDLSLLEALRQGGFNYPADATHDATSVDSDGVSLGQRKNQLSRRLRLARQSQQKKHNKNKACQDPNTETGRNFNMSGNKRRSCGESEDGDSDSDTPDIHPCQQSPSSSGTVPGSQQEVPGGVRSSLLSTASSVGMTLEQLALSLSSSPNLFRSLSTHPDPETKLQLAVNLYKADAPALLNKSMVSTGFAGRMLNEGSSQYMQVALKIWEAEGKRLQQLLGNASQQGNSSNGLPSLRDGRAAQSNNESSSKPAAAKHDDSHDHDHDHNHLHSHNHLHDHREAQEKAASGVATDDTKPDRYAKATDGRHIHRLDGKCGHRAIIHQPEGQPPHVDFVVKGKVECFQGIKPIGPKGRDALWPSRYKCIELSCPTDPNEQRVACGSNDAECGDGHNAVSKPKELPLSDVDFDDKEWKIDFFNHDSVHDEESAHGLIRLSDTA